MGDVLYIIDTKKLEVFERICTLNEMSYRDLSDYFINDNELDWLLKEGILEYNENTYKYSWTK